MERLRKGTLVILLVSAVLLAGLVPPPAEAFNQPAYNLGLTNALDGAIPGPGLYMMAYTQFYWANSIDVNGEMPEPVKSILEDTEVSTLAAPIQIAWISKGELFGGYLGWIVVIPVVVIDTDGPINQFIQDSANVGPITGTSIENTGGVGDLITGPVIQWSGKSLLGRPFFHRFEFDIIFPTGKYSDRYLINPGSNVITINPFYSCTWFPTPKTDVSFRFHYAWNSRNNSPYKVLYGPDAQLRPGQNIHFNYTIEQNVYQSLWLGVAGYCMWQIENDSLKNSTLPAASPAMAKALVQKERVFGIGPILTFTPTKKMVLSWATAFEVGVKNRSEGFKSTFKILYKFW